MLLYLKENCNTNICFQASVRLIINYNKTHKAVVRVSPTVPLEMLLPVICDKCELKVETTVLLTDSQSKDLLDMTKTLNEHGLREVFAKDTTAKELGDIEHKTPESVHGKQQADLMLLSCSFTVV